jgi:hypothetical protein
MKELMIIEINDEGLFEKTPEKIMYVPCNSTILFVFVGKQHAQLNPMLLSNYRNSAGKRYQLTPAESGTITVARLKAEFNWFEGNFEVNLNWSCRINFNHPGLYFFQIVFAEKQEGVVDSVLDNSHIVIAPDHFEYLIVNPTFAHFSTANLNRLSERSLSSRDTLSPRKMKSSDGSRLTMSEGMDLKRIKSLNYEDSCNDDTQAASLGSILDPLIRTNCPSFDTISLVTLYPTMMGELSQWDSELDYLHGRGFHGIHFSPIQQLGASNSLYSIKDPLVLNPNIFRRITATKN